MERKEAPTTHTDGYGIKRILTTRQRAAYAAGYNTYMQSASGSVYEICEPAYYKLGFAHAQAYQLCGTA